MIHPLIELLNGRFESNKSIGKRTGIYASCTANELVIEASILKALACDDLLLVEATSNQVNQYGGYTGMQPEAFARYVYTIAKRLGFPRHRIILGGDHLGPLVWTSLPAEKAMNEAKELIRLYVKAGFSKIHLDTSMRLADDDKKMMLNTEVIASRAVDLAVMAEKTYTEVRASGLDWPPPVYVIGSEVPIPSLWKRL